MQISAITWQNLLLQTDEIIIKLFAGNRKKGFFEMIFDYQKKYDIAISGAGIAGISAALAAARRGHKVVLLEKQALIGGLATSGLIYIYLPLCDGNGTQVSFGITEELLRISTEFSPFDIPEKWNGPAKSRALQQERYQCEFSPAGFILSLDKLLRNAGVDLWLDTRVCAVQKASDGKIIALEVENCSGRGRIAAGYFVDATGDATLIRRSGGKTEIDENTHSLWMIQTSPEEKKPFPFTDSINIAPFGGKKVEGDARDAKVHSTFIRESWNTAREYYKYAYDSGKSSRYNHYPLHLPAMVQLRKIACINGVESLDSESEWKHYDSSVGLYADWRGCGMVYETPYGSLIPADVRGIFAAGRCICTRGDAWEAYRVIPAAAMTGEIAGVGASLAVERKCDALDLSPEDLRRELRKNNFKFYFEEAGLDPDQYRREK